MHRLLLTGFEPFGNIEINPTESIVLELMNESEEKGISNITSRVLPVTAEASEIVDSLLAKNYDFVLHLGLHIKIEDFSIERLGINLDDYRIPDNKGIQIKDRPIYPDGENAYFSTLPIRDIEGALIKENIPCHLSYSAGTYICNHLLYTTLHFIQKNGLGVKAGFIHIPPFEKMGFHQMLKGVKVIMGILGFGL